MSRCEFLTPKPNRRGLQLYVPISVATDSALGLEAEAPAFAQVTPSGGLLLTPCDALDSRYPQSVPAPPPDEYDAAIDAADLATHEVPGREELLAEAQPQQLTD